MIRNSGFQGVLLALLWTQATLSIGCYSSLAMKADATSSEPVQVAESEIPSPQTDVPVPNPEPADDAVAVVPENPPADIPQDKEAKAVKAAPTILRLEPASGRVGQKIRLSGQNLDQVGAVQFAVGYVSKKADFRVVSDAELEVTVPEFYRVESSFEAAITVIGSGGVSVTCPATADVIRESVRFQKSHFLHVLDGGSVEDARCVTVIEPGGIVTRIYGAAWTFVRDGGVLGKADYAGTVFYEEGARLGQTIKHPGKEHWNRTVVAAVKVPRIHVAEGLGPFTYESTSSTAVSKQDPRITSIQPHRVHPGAIVTITGQGFSGTTNAWLSGDYGTMKPAGFRVVSDEQLKLEVPHMDRCKFSVTLLTGRGATVAVSKEVIMHPGEPVPEPKNNPPQNFGPLVSVRKGEVADRGGGAYLMFVEEGGKVAGASARAFFVKRGGSVTTSNVAWYFTEEGARVPDKVSPRYKVDTVTLSVVKEPLDLFPQ
jgi:hypothetical protein